MNTTPKVAYYMRCSTDDKESLSLQKRHLEKLLIKRIDLMDQQVEIYEDECQSGVKPGINFIRMHRDISEGKINVVMVDRLDRIPVSPIYNFLNFLRIKKVRFLCYDGNLDS